MAIDDDIREIRGVVNEMNTRGLENAKVQGSMQADIQNIKDTLVKIEKLSHSPSACPLVIENKGGILTLLSKVTNLEKRKPAKNSLKKEMGILTGIAGAIYGAIELVKGLLKP